MPNFKAQVFLTVENAADAEQAGELARKALMTGHVAIQIFEVRQFNCVRPGLPIVSFPPHAEPISVVRA